MLVNEIWRPVEWAPMYIVSNHGNVANERTGLVLTPGFDRGRRVLKLRVEGTNQNFKIARLVAKAFCPGYHESLEVNHKDGNKANDYYSNLEWVTRRYNVQHAFRTGLAISGRRMPIRIIETGEEFESQTACAEAIGGFQPNVNMALRKNRPYKGFTFEYVEE